MSTFLITGGTFLLIFLILLGSFGIPRVFGGIKRAKKEKPSSGVSFWERSWKILSSLAPLLIGYGAFLYGLFLLFPQTWETYWHNQEIFWWSQAAVLGVALLMVTSGHTPKLIATALLVLLGIMLTHVLPETEPAQQSARVAAPAQATGIPPSSPHCGRSVRIQATQKYRGVRGRGVTCRLMWEKDDFSMRNMLGLIAIRPNGDDSQVQYHGRLPSGKMAHADFEKLKSVDTLEFKSLEKYPVKLTVFWRQE